jgi:signal transduction histidine kinase
VSATGAVGDTRLPPRGRKLRHQLVVLLAVAGLGLGVAGILLLGAIANQRDRRVEVTEQYDPAALAARDLRAAMIDQETGVRGYTLSRDRSFLAPYDVARSAQATATATLDSSLPRSADADEAQAQLASAIDAWQQQVALPTIAQLDRGDPVPRTPVAQDASKASFDQVRSGLDQLDAVIAVRRDRALGKLKSAFETVVVVAVAALVGLVGLGVLIAVATRRSVLRPLDELASEVRLVADGELAHPIEGVGAPEFLALAADVEAMRRRIVDELDHLSAANRSIAQQAEELERSNADLEQFAYVASHDLQEPLRKIAGFCQLLERRYKGQLDERADQYIEFAVDGAKRMQDLINDLLAFSRVGRNTERFVAVELGDALTDALANLEVLRAAADATIDAGDLPSVAGDRRLLTAVFQNLVGNAIKFRGSEAPRIAITSVRDGGEWVISVADNGIGVDPDYREQIFALFQRLHTRSEYDGTGIGLALCQKIVEFHGGRIWLEPSESPGATFRFSLPAREDSA